MKRIHAVWMSTFLIAACSGKDHSLGLGKTPATPGTSETPVAEDTPAGSGGMGMPEQPVSEMTRGSGGASAGAIPDASAPPPKPMGAGGAPLRGTGGMTSSVGSTGTGGTTGAGVGAPIIPQVSGECPTWQDSMITFMGLGGIQIAAGDKAPSPSAPMIMYWHGTVSNAGEYQLMAAPIAAGVTQAGGIVVSFEGTKGGDILSGTSIFGAADLPIVDQLVACAVRDHNVAPRRIYTTGCSAGGLFAAAMTALRSNYVAAGSANSGGWTLPVDFQNEYTPPLMTVHGSTGADIVLVDFSQTSATADAAFKARGGFVINCNTGGGHCGGSGLAGDVWKFFLAHPYGVAPEPWSAGLPAGFSSQCEIQ